MGILNPVLVERQGLTDETVERLENLHIAMKTHKYRPLEEIEDIPKYVDLIREIEFGMQRLWGFDEDASYHQHWFRDPKCQCPTLDNQDLIGIDRNIINSKCPLHGLAKVQNAPIEK